MEALEACGKHDEARLAIEVARSRLLDRAARITDSDRRASFLRNVPSVARTMDLARQWGVDP